MSTSFLDFARRIVRSKKETKPVKFGPWLGSKRDISADQVPRDFLASPLGTEKNFFYDPADQSFKRRGGQTQKFDTYAASVGNLPASWSARGRWMEEFKSDSISDSIPTVATLATKETVASGLDDGAFANLHLRDQVNAVNYTLGDEFSTTLTYPVPTSIQGYKVVPLWYDSGDGGYTRGTAEFARRFLVSGSRRFAKVGNWVYFPSFKGTPSRWNGRFLAGSANSGVTATTMNAAGAWTDQSGGVLNLGSVIDEFPADDADFVKVDVNAGGQISLDLNVATPSPLPSASTPHTIQFRYRRTGGSGTGPGLVYTFYKGNTAVTIKSTTLANLPVTTAWTDYSYSLSAAEITSISNPATGGGAYNLMSFLFNWTGSAGTAGSLIEVSMLRISFGNAITAATLASEANRLIPSGPFPPTHCGTVAGASAVTEEPTYLDGDVSAGSWTKSGGGAATYTTIDEAVADDTDFIRITNANDTCIFTLATPTTAPVAADTVTIRFRAYSIVGSSPNKMTCTFYTGATTIASTQITWTVTSGVAAYALTLTAAQMATMIAADPTWAGARIGFTTGSLSAPDSVLVTQAYMGRLDAAADSEGGWKGKDRFYRAFYYRFEDDSIWMLTTPRAPGTLLANGLDLVTVDATNPETAYTKITHSNIPIGPFGVKKVGICRCPKIDSTVDDNLLLDPTDMRFVAEVDNGTTTYDDYKGDDLSIEIDLTGELIRFDHSMPPRARYIGAGDMRVIHSYGGTNPAAIVIAPVGATVDYDLNVADTSATAYAGKMYMRFAIDSAGVGTLTLNKWDGTTTVSVTSFAVASGGSYDTLQKLVDAINASNCADTTTYPAGQWRAQLCPGASPDAACLTALTPHSRVMASCTVSGQTITLAGGGLSKIPLGYFILRSGVATSAYISRIDSDTQLTFVGTVTAGTVDLTFYADLGDFPATAGPVTIYGYQRVIANSLPGFLYFTKTYLNTQTLDKSATWMTTAAPGAVKSAPNCFVLQGNRFTPPLEAGIAMGGVGVDNGFVLFWASKRGAIRNTRDSGTGRDQDYRLFITNESSGCAAWNTVVAGNRCAIGLSAEGMIVSDLFKERIFSGNIWAHPNSDATTGIGDFSYELPQSIAATAQDNDSSYATARIMRSCVFVCYRSSASSATLNDRRVRYDFSMADDLNGLQAFFRKNGEEWGWGYPESSTTTAVGTSMSAMCEGRRSDGSHLYGWNDANLGTNAGRIDEFDTGTQDNAVDIAGSWSTPWMRAPEGMLVSVQEILTSMLSPTGSTGALNFHRTFSSGSANDTDFAMTPGTNGLVVLDEVKLLDTRARAQCNAFYINGTQATGAARELRWLQAALKYIRRMK